MNKVIIEKSSSEDIEMPIEVYISLLEHFTNNDITKVIDLKALQDKYGKEQFDIWYQTVVKQIYYWENMRVTNNADKNN